MEEEAAAAEEAAGARKRKRGVSGEDVAAGLVAEEVEEQEGGVYEKGLLMEVDEEEGCYEGIAEEAVAEVMRWLEAEISDDLAPLLPGTKADEDEDLGFVTINGNEESCGPSFSCAASTVMASVDTRAGAPPPPPVPWPFPEPAAKKKLESATGDAEKMVVADEEEAWLAELLACGPSSSSTRTGMAPSGRSNKANVEFILGARLSPDPSASVVVSPVKSRVVPSCPGRAGRLLSIDSGAWYGS